ncbi:metalloprotease, partial [Coemansia sp. RSA 2599]
PSWHYTQVLPELNKVGLSDLQSFADHVADQAFFTTLVAGDFEESDALDIASKVDTLLNSTALPEYLLSNGRVISLDPGYFVYQAAAPEKKTKNSAFRGEIYCGDTGDRQEAMALMLLKSILHEPFFDQLRTKEQLGYQVGVSHKKYGSSQYITLIVQGESSPAYMTMRAESFIRSFRKQLVDYDEESLATKISSLVELILEKPKTIFKEASELWSEIDSGNYDFGAKAKSAQVLKSLTKSHLIEFWDKYINPDTAPSYKRIDSQIWSSFTLQPTEVQFGNYSLSAVALQGCLHQEGVANISLSAANDIIASSSSSDHGVPFALKMIQDIVAKDYHDSEELLVKIMEPTSKTRIALQMAMDQAAEKRSFAAAGSQNFTKIGMHQSPDGIWLINDIRRFKASQQLKARRLPFNQPQPIY